MKRFFFILAFFAGLSFCLVGPINRTPLHERAFYQELKSTFDTLKLIPSAKGKLKVGWSSFGIIPNHTMPMAGYAPRKSFDSVHDSLYTKILSISNGYTTTYLITIDLLIFPPTLKQLLEARMKSAIDFIYLSASHTHSGLGGWNESVAGQFIAGNYNEKWLKTLADSIISNMNKANHSSRAASLSYWETDASEYVSNRLEDHGKTDGKLRGIQVVREDSIKAIMFTYSAHPTNIDHLSKILSGDYPNATNKALEKKGFAFSMFMAGMMGSHRLDHIEGSDYELVNNTAEKLSDKIEKASVGSMIDSASITYRSIDLPMGSSQLRITDNWKLRDWLFAAALGRLEATITYLKIGDMLFLGTSCDFSGELAVSQKLGELANKRGIHLIITSFNGNYTGYITDDIHYNHAEKEEVRAMNWVGPYYGAYYSEIVNLLIQK
jgi:hypothetical protein